jgi:hypothetical protein
MTNARHLSKKKVQDLARNSVPVAMPDDQQRYRQAIIIDHETCKKSSNARLQPNSDVSPHSK